MENPINSWETIAKASELPSRSMKLVEIKCKEIAIINLDGKYYAINDRCGHMNAPLSKGESRNVQGKDIVTCTLHFSTFDILTGKKLSEPNDVSAYGYGSTPQTSARCFCSCRTDNGICQDI
jgi:nitrite reductase/ring-hydroxylating ferredoxin subunit